MSKTKGKKLVINYDTSTNYFKVPNTFVELSEKLTKNQIRIIFYLLQNGFNGNHIFIQDTIGKKLGIQRTHTNRDINNLIEMGILTLSDEGNYIINLTVCVPLMVRTKNGTYKKNSTINGTLEVPPMVHKEYQEWYANSTTNGTLEPLQPTIDKGFEVPKTSVNNTYEKKNFENNTIESVKQNDLNLSIEGKNEVDVLDITNVINTPIVVPQIKPIITPNFNEVTNMNTSTPTVKPIHKLRTLMKGGIPSQLVLDEKPESLYLTTTNKGNMYTCYNAFINLNPNNVKVKFSLFELVILGMVTRDNKVICTSEDFNNYVGAYHQTISINHIHRFNEGYKYLKALNTDNPNEYQELVNNFKIGNNQ